MNYYITWNGSALSYAALACLALHLAKLRQCARRVATLLRAVSNCRQPTLRSPKPMSLRGGNDSATADDLSGEVLDDLRRRRVPKEPNPKADSTVNQSSRRTVPGPRAVKTNTTDSGNSVGYHRFYESIPNSQRRTHVRDPIWLRRWAATLPSAPLHADAVHDNEDLHLVRCYRKATDKVHSTRDRQHKHRQTRAELVLQLNRAHPRNQDSSGITRAR